MYGPTIRGNRVDQNTTLGDTNCLFLVINDGYISQIDLLPFVYLRDLNVTMKKRLK